MPEYSSFFDSTNGDRVYSSKDFAAYFKNFLSNGVYNQPSTSLQVLSNNNFTVGVQSGYAFLEGYRYENSDVINYTIASPDAVLNRRDLVVIQLDITNRWINSYIKQGEPASNPVRPELERSDIIYEIALAEIYVGKAATSISQMNITDLRGDNTVCGWVHGLIQQVDTTTIFNQYESWYLQKTEQYENDWNTWFDAMREQVSSDDHSLMNSRLDALESGKMNKAITVITGQNLNTWSANGWFYGGSLVGAPNGSYYFFQHIETPDRSNRTQTLNMFDGASHITYRRTWDNTFTSWNSWFKTGGSAKPFVKLYTVADETLIPNTSVYTKIKMTNQPQDWNVTTHEYTIPATGDYMFNLSLVLTGMTAGNNTILYLQANINGVAQFITYKHNDRATTNLQGTYAGTLNAGDKVSFSLASSGNATLSASSWNRIIVQLVQPS